MKYTYKIVVALVCIGFSTLISWSQEAKHLVIISIDGFRSDFYTQDKWPTPNLKDLAHNGVYAEGVNGIFPTVTYPSHTTLITGVGPDKHGIYYNTEIGENGKPGNWIYDFSKIKSETLWEVAKSKDLKTASVSWPISVNSPFIDYNIPEIWSFTNPMDRRGATQKYAQPKGLFEEAVSNATGNLNINDYNLSSLSMDQNLGRIAGYILKTYKPNLLTIHLPNTDGAQHKNGREGIEVEKAIAGADQAVSTIIDALKKADIYDQTNIIITGDHGFVTVHSSIAPNIWLSEIGLSSSDGSDDKAFFFSTGGSTFLHLKDENDEKSLEKIVGKLNSLPFSLRNTFRIVSREEMSLRGADPSAVLALTATDGFSFTNSTEGGIINSAHGGKHGHFPDSKNIQTGFIGFGPDFENGKIIPEIQIEDIGPIAAFLLGTKLEASKGMVYDGMISKSK